MPRDATRPFSRSDSSSCAIRCRLLLEVLELCFLLPWRAGLLLSFSLALSLLGYWLRTMELEGFVAGLSCLALECMSMGMGLGLGPAHLGYASRTANETVLLDALAPLRAASTYHFWIPLEHCSLQAVSSRLTASCDLATCDLQAASCPDKVDSWPAAASLLATHSSLLGFRRLDLVLVDACLPAWTGPHMLERTGCGQSVGIRELPSYRSSNIGSLHSAATRTPTFSMPAAAAAPHRASIVHA